MSEEIYFANYKFRLKKFEEKIVLPYKKTLVGEEKIASFKINQEKSLIDKRYRFIDLEKLNKVKGKKYNVSELRDIAKKIGVDPENKKTELVKLIKDKIKIK